VFSSRPHCQGLEEIPQQRCAPGEAPQQRTTGPEARIRAGAGHEAGVTEASHSSKFCNGEISREHGASSADHITACGASQAGFLAGGRAAGRERRWKIGARAQNWCKRLGEGSGCGEGSVRAEAASGRATAAQGSEK